MNRTRLIVGGALAVAVIAGGLWLATRRDRTVDTGPATDVVARRDLSSTLTALGVVRAMVGAEVKVGSRVSGRVDKLYANVGDEVQEGEVIALIDDRDLRAKLDRARADVQAVEATWREAVAAAGAQPARTSATIAEASSVSAASRSRLQQAQVAADAQPVATESQIEQARRALAAARARRDQAQATSAAQPRSTAAQVEQARAALRVAEANLTRVRRGARTEEVSQAAAAVRQAEARLRETQVNLERAETLYARDYIAAQEVDRRRTERDVAQAELESARERLTLLRTQTLPEDLDRAQAEVARARANLDEAQSAAVAVELRQRDVAAAEAEVKRAEAALKAAEAGRSQDEIKRSEVDSARAEVARAEAGRRSAQADAVQNELKRRAADAARGRLSQAQAAVRSAEAELSYTRITASISGVIASVTTQEGETVSAGLAAPTFVTIIDLERLEVHAYVDETDIGKVEVGQDASFTVDAYPDRDFQGRVTAVHPKGAVEQGIVEYQVVISVEKPGGLLKPDMTANVTIFAEKHPDTLSVPNRAIRREAGRTVVYVMDRGRPVARPVKTGVRDADYTEIREGVQEGDVVFLEPPAAHDNPGGR